MNHIWHALKVFSHPSILLFLCKAISSDTRLVECHLHQVMGYKDSLGTTTWWWVRSRQVVEFRRTSCGASALSVQWCHWGPLEKGFLKFETTGKCHGCHDFVGVNFSQKDCLFIDFLLKDTRKLQTFKSPWWSQGWFRANHGQTFRTREVPSAELKGATWEELRPVRITIPVDGCSTSFWRICIGEISRPCLVHRVREILENLSVNEWLELENQLIRSGSLANFHESHQSQASLFGSILLTDKISECKKQVTWSPRNDSLEEPVDFLRSSWWEFPSLRR